MIQRLLKQPGFQSITLPQIVNMQAVLTCAIALLAFGLRMYRLGVQSLWLDEGGTWAVVTQSSWPKLLSDLFSPAAAYPLYHLLLKGWLMAAGDSEWALRFPSALVGTAMVIMLMLAAREALPETQVAPFVVGMFSACSPYALWHAQDAKVYSLLMFTIAVLLWAGLRYNRSHLAPGRALLALGSLAALSLFVHRLALLPVAGLILSLAMGIRRSQPNYRQRILGLALAAAAATLGVVGLSSAVSSNGWQESGHSTAEPIQSLWLNLQHFILDRGDIGGVLGLPLMLWATPTLVLTLLGLVLLCGDAWRGSVAAGVVLALFVVPLVLYALVLAFRPIYEARYAAVAFPAWLLVLVWPISKIGHQHSAFAARFSGFSLCVLGFSSLAVSVAVLLQPQHGLFSGAAVKEQWRESVAAVAAEAQPDDLIVLHPYYALPLWQYYAPRATPDPLQSPIVFAVFGEGLCVEVNHAKPQAIRECYRRTYDTPFNAAAEGKKRALLLIAPDHAATIDPPKSLVDLQDEYAAGLLTIAPTQPDRYGWVGLRFLYPQRFWACGSQEFLGTKTMCLSFPETFRASTGIANAPPRPALSLEATFGGEIKLLGYSLHLFGGKIRPGGTLPVTLYWQSRSNPTKNYSMFLHLCQHCDQPPLAATDGPPLRGYPPAGLTSTWRGYPVHDERSLQIPATLTPGRYTLILGLRPADEDSANLALRLPVARTQAQILGGNRIILGTVEIGE